MKEISPSGQGQEALAYYEGEVQPVVIIIVLTYCEGVVPPVALTEESLQIVCRPPNYHWNVNNDNLLSNNTLFTFRWRHQGPHYQEQDEHPDYGPQPLDKVHVSYFNCFRRPHSEYDRDSGKIFSL